MLEVTGTENVHKCSAPVRGMRMNMDVTDEDHQGAVGVAAETESVEINVYKCTKIVNYHSLYDRRSMPCDREVTH